MADTAHGTEKLRQARMERPHPVAMLFLLAMVGVPAWWCGQSALDATRTYQIRCVHNADASQDGCTITRTGLLATLLDFHPGRDIHDFHRDSYTGRSGSRSYLMMSTGGGAVQVGVEQASETVDAQVTALQQFLADPTVHPVAYTVGDRGLFSAVLLGFFSVVLGTLTLAMVWGYLKDVFAPRKAPVDPGPGLTPDGP